MNSPQRIFGLDRNVFLLGVVSLLTDVSSEMIYPLIPVFLTTVLGAGMEFVGLVEGVAESTASLLKIFSGWISDRLGMRKRLVLGGYGLSTLSRPLMAAATSGWHVLVVRFADRVGKGVRTSPRDALIAASSGSGEWGRSFGFHRGMDHAGAILGPLFAFGMLGYFGWGYRTIFWWAFLPGLLSVAVLLWGVSEQVPTASTGSSLPAPMRLSLAPFDRRFRLFLLLVGLFTLGNSSDAFLILRAEQGGIPVAHLPLLWVALHITKMTSSLPAGILSDRIGRRGLILSGWFLYALVYLGFAYATSILQIWGLFLAYGIYFGLTEGVEKAMIADLVSESHRGTAYGLYHGAIGLTALPASLFMGFLWETIGLHAAFGFGAAMAVLAAVGFSLLRITPHIASPQSHPPSGRRESR
jgi:MFS family permease